MAGKSRSRNYPAFGLADAIQKARQLYDRDGRAAVGADVAVQAWGYSGLNGASLRTLGAMRQYGLLDAPAPKTVKLSHDALTILLEPDDSPERAEAIRSAATAPAMFQEIREQYPDNLPSDTAVISWLVRTHQFNGDAAKGLIASYRDTMGLVDQAGKRDIPPRRDRHEQDQGGDQPPTDRGNRMRPAVFSYVLPGNTTATLTLDGEAPGEAAVGILGVFLDLVKQSLMMQAKQRVESQSAPGQEPGAD